ncbi:hypothetical protein ACOMHN_004367 [Nucella lapillus]
MNGRCPHADTNKRLVARAQRHLGELPSPPRRHQNKGGQVMMSTGCCRPRSPPFLISRTLSGLEGLALSESYSAGFTLHSPTPVPLVKPSSSVVKATVLGSHYTPLPPSPSSSLLPVS